jgi:cation diffusion facilitator CzcD-associated flavoprotein CzcO
LAGGETLPAVVVGAGPAGLATSRELRRRGIDHRVLERGDRLGAAWAAQYDSLTLHTGKHLSALPGLRFPRSTPLFPKRDEFLAYLERYARQFALPVELSRRVTGIAARNGGFALVTPQGALGAGSVVVATGIMSNPQPPELPGRSRFGGRVIHSVEYRRPEPFAGQRVLVVGSGNSAGEIAAELAAAGVRVVLAVRSGANVVPRQLLGLPIQYWALPLSRLPRRAQRAVLNGLNRLGELRRGPAVLPRENAPNNCPDVPLIGFGLVDAIRAGKVEVRPGLAGFGPGSVIFADGRQEPVDSVILATGYRAAVDFLGGLIRRDPCGFALRRDRVESADRPGLFFVGHNYDTRGGLYNIALDARRAARGVARRAARGQEAEPA